MNIPSAQCPDREPGPSVWWAGVGGLLLVLNGACAQDMPPLSRPEVQAEAPAPTATREAPRMSLNVRQADVRSLLHMLAAEQQMNLVLAEGVSGQISLKVQDVPWSRTLQMVLDAKGLAARTEGRVMWVAPRDEWLQRDRQSLEARTALEQAAPLQTRVVKLQYARAAEVAQRLGSPAGAWLSPRAALMAEPRTNQLFVSEVPARIEALLALIGRMDVAVRQVAIEAQIVEADEQFGASLGTRVGLSLAVPLRSSAHPLTASVGAGLATSATASGTGAGAAPTGGTVPGNNLNWPAGQAGQVLVPPAALGVSLFNAGADRFINLEISALEATGRGKVVSRPRVVTADQTKALIEQGTELPYQTTSAAGGTTLTSITFRKANLKLEVTPQITPEGTVVLEVDVNRDSVGQLTPAGYAITTKHVRTQVQVEDGGTVVLGGIFEEGDKRDDARLPGLSQLPILGWLFRNQQSVRRHSELLVFLTPRILQELNPASPASPRP